MDEIRNLSMRAVTLASGRPLAPGEAAPCDLTDPHDQQLLDTGLIGPVDGDTPTAKRRRDTKED